MRQPAIFMAKNGGIVFQLHQSYTTQLYYFLTKLSITKQETNESVKYFYGN